MIVLVVLVVHWVVMVVHGEVVSDICLRSFSLGVASSAVVFYDVALNFV